MSITNGGDRSDPKYIIPAAVLLEQLGVNKSELSGDRVSISVVALKRLIAAAINLSQIDDNAYLSAYPDVRGAILAGEISSGQEHFSKAGYYENRIPGMLPFDPDWYRSHYKDIAQHFQRDQDAEMHEHFLKTGYFEGRVGTEQDLLILQGWLK